MEDMGLNWGLWHWLSLLGMGLLGLLLGKLWFNNRADGDLNVEGEARLRQEADDLRAKLRAAEAERTTLVEARDTEITDLRGKLAAAAAGAAAGAVATKAAADTPTATDTAAAAKDDEEAYALEWRNRYLAARVKYLEGRLAEAPEAAPVKAPVKAKAKSSSTAKTTAAGAALAGAAGATAVASARKRKPAAAPKTTKPKAKARPKPKVLYTDGPTDGEPDDLKKIKGIGPKFEKDLNDKGIYYYRQIGAWKKSDVSMVEGVIKSFPGRIDRDEWIPQAKGLAKGGGAKATTTRARTTAGSSTAKAATAAAAGTVASRKKPGPKPGTKRGALNADGTPRRKPGPKPGTAKAARPAKEVALDRYHANVQKYDGGVSRDVVANIVKYCGVSLRSRDTSLVACSDPKEKDRIAKGFASKKLGIADLDERRALVERTCQDMKASRQKSRVTFYYLMAKNAGRLDVFGG